MKNIVNEIYNLQLQGSLIKQSFETNAISIVVNAHHDVPLQYLLDFFHKAQLTGANPALGQIHLTTYFNKRLGHKVGVTVFSYHYFLNCANQTGEYEGLEVSSNVEKVFNPMTSKEIPQLVSTATVRRKNKGSVTFKARWQECANVNNDMWRNKPYIMLEKTAIANALRWAFPEALSGMYIQEEISQNDDLSSKGFIEVAPKPKTTIDIANKDPTPVNNSPKFVLQNMEKENNEKEAVLSEIKNYLADATKGFTPQEKIHFLSFHFGVATWQGLEKLGEVELKEKISYFKKATNE